MTTPTHPTRRPWMRGLLAGLGIAFAITLTGCNNCEKMAEKVCADLGDDCALWKELGGPEDIRPQGRKVNKACGMMMDNDLAMEGTVNGARAKVLAERLQRAMKKGDKDEIEKVKKAMKENQKRLQEGLEKVKARAGH